MTKDFRLDRLSAFFTSHKPAAMLPEIRFPHIPKAEGSMAVEFIKI